MLIYFLIGEIASVFGKGTLDFIINVIEQGKLDYLSRMPENILLKIVSCLPLEDIARFSQTNSLFRQVKLFSYLFRN